MWGGFKCSRNSLVVLNVFYVAVGILLIWLAAGKQSSNGLLGLPIIGGIIACGVFLLIVSIGGIYATLRHHQVLLFFYMVILFVLFIIQFSIACACLAVSETTQRSLGEQGWSNVGNDTKATVQSQLSCCGYINMTATGALVHPSCMSIPTCKCDGWGIDVCGNDCTTCESKIQGVIADSFQLTGGVSLFFSFTEIIGAMLACHYRNLYSPLRNMPS